MINRLLCALCLKERQAVPLTAVNSVIAEGSPSRVPRRSHFPAPLDEDYSQGPADSTDSGTHKQTNMIEFIFCHVLKSCLFFFLSRWRENHFFRKSVYSYQDISVSLSTSGLHRYCL